MTEEWRPVLGYEGFYEVSNEGFIRSVDRTIQRSSRPARWKGRPVALVTRSGRTYAQLSKVGQKGNRFVDETVLEAFVGPRPDGMDCCHNDDDPLNNRLDNLRWRIPPNATFCLGHPNRLATATNYRNGCRCLNCRDVVVADARKRRERIAAGRPAVAPAPSLPGERWGDIPGYEGRYQASNLGRVKSLPRIVVRKDGRTMNLPGVLFKASKTRLGYLLVSLPGRTTAKVHRLVLEAFVGPIPEGMVTRHLNGKPADNRLQNLAYGTQSENMYDRIAHGKHRQTSQTHCIREHPLSGENLYVAPDGKRQCRTCTRDRKRSAA